MSFSPQKLEDSQGSPSSFSAALAALLASIAFPATTDSLRSAAARIGAGNELLAAFRGLPEREYRCADEVTAALGDSHA